MREFHLVQLPYTLPGPLRIGVRPIAWAYGKSDHGGSDCHGIRIPEITIQSGTKHRAPNGPQVHTYK